MPDLHFLAMDAGRRQKSSKIDAELLNCTCSGVGVTATLGATGSAGREASACSRPREGTCSFHAGPVLQSKGSRVRPSYHLV